jgi:RimJ/RimL family protein N-acetyltransferase
MLKYGLHYRCVNKEDADFIFKLRANNTLSKYLTQTNGTIRDQEEWIGNYKIKEAAKEEFYFIYETERKQPLGVNRIYNIKETQFEVGSWLFDPMVSSKFESIIADIIAKDFGFEELGVGFCVFEVRKENQKVSQYHKRFNPEITGEDDLNYYYKLSYKNYIAHRNKLLNLLNYGNK